MPEYLPINKIKVEISTFDSNKWIYIPKPIKPNDDEKNDAGYELQRDIESDPFPLTHVKSRVLSQSFFGFCKVPLEMDERIVESGLKVLENVQESKSKKDLEKKEKAHRDEIKEGLKRQQVVERKIDKIEQKLDQLLNQMVGNNDRQH
jgi:hypothetical protein